MYSSPEEREKINLNMRPAAKNETKQKKGEKRRKGNLPYHMCFCMGFIDTMRHYQLISY